MATVGGVVSGVTVTLLVADNPAALVTVTRKLYVPAMEKVAVVVLAALVPLALKMTGPGGRASGGPGVCEVGFAAGRVSAEYGEDCGGVGHSTGVGGGNDGRIGELPDFRGGKGPVDDAEIVQAAVEEPAAQGILANIGDAAECLGGIRRRVDGRLHGRARRLHVHRGIAGRNDQRHERPHAVGDCQPRRPTPAQGVVPVISKLARGTHADSRMPSRSRSDRTRFPYSRSACRCV